MVELYNSIKCLIRMHQSKTIYLNSSYSLYYKNIYDILIWGHSKHVIMVWDRCTINMVEL